MREHLFSQFEAIELEVQADYMSKTKHGVSENSRSVSPKRRSFIMNVWQTKSLAETLKKIAKIRERVFGPDTRFNLRRNSTMIGGKSRAMSDSQVILEFKSLSMNLTNMRSEITRERYNNLLSGMSSTLVG